jgi:hypothetical protein
LKIEAVCSSETSANFYKTIGRYIAEGSTLNTQFYKLRTLKAGKKAWLTADARNNSWQGNLYKCTGVIVGKIVGNNTVKVSMRTWDKRSHCQKLVPQRGLLRETFRLRFKRF